MLLDLQKSGALTSREKQEIDVLIERAIKEHKGNSAQINKLTMDSVTALTVSEARANELSNQGFFKRVLGNITGKNQELRADIDRNITKAQYASQQMIQKLAEQNLLTFDIVTAVNNKLNTLVIELDLEINQVYQTMIAFFKQTRSDIIQIEARVEKLERNVELLHWNATIEYQMYDGVEYTELHDITKIVCLSNDFFHRTKGEWSTGDLMLLKSTLAELGLAVKSNIFVKNFYNNLIEKPSLIERLFEGISLEGLEVTETYEAPLVKGIEKLTKINGEEKYVYETIAVQLEAADVPYEKQSLKLSIIHQYLLQTASMNSDAEINLFDFVVGLLVDLHMINFSVSSIDQTQIIINDIAMPENKQGDYDVFLFSYGEDKMALIKAISDVNKISLEESKKLINNLPINILSRRTLDHAEEVAKRLENLGAQVRVKTYIEHYHTVRSDALGKIFLNGAISVGEILRSGVVKTHNYEKANFVNVNKGDKVSSVTRVALIGKDLLNTHDILAGVKGEVISVLVSHRDEININDPIMVIEVKN